MNELSTISNVKDLVFNPSAMDQMMRLAEVMAKSICTVPNHLQKNVGDCFAIVMQSAQWGMNPFVVAQKTHIVNGKLGYEAQLVHALINTMSPIKGHLKFEWRGDWDKYINNGLQKADEKGLCVVVSGVLQGDDKPTENTTYLAPQVTRNSPLWKTDPKMQLAYLGIKRWSGLHTPSVTLGVYTVEELQDGGLSEKVINPLPTETQDFSYDLKNAKTLQELSSAWKQVPPSEKPSLLALKDEMKEKLMQSAVVATVEKAPEAKKAPEKEPDTTDWANLVENAQTVDELNAILKSMTPVEQDEWYETIDFKKAEIEGM
jgi:hypothetical protein